MEEYQTDLMDRTIEPEHLAHLTRIQQANPIVPHGGHGTIAVGAPGGAMGFVGAQPVPVRRDLAAVMRDLKIMAAMAGDRYFYRWDVKNKDGSVQTVIGPSIKAANDIARLYGNNHVAVRAFDEGRHWTFYARFHDVESGYSLERAFIQPKGQATIKSKDAERREQMAFAMGQSKAIRNVIVNALGTLSDFAVQEAQASLITRIGRNLPGARDRLAQKLASMKIDLVRVERIVGRPLAEMLAPDISRVVVSLQTIADGMAAADDLFPDPNAAPPQEPARPTDPPGGQADTPPATAVPPPPTPAADPIDPAYEVEVPLKDDGSPDWMEWRHQMEGYITDADTSEALDKLRRANGKHLVAFAKANGKEGDQILALFAQRSGELAGGGQ